MPYTTGTVGTAGALQTAIRAAAFAGGWSADGDILYKGDCNVAVTVATSTWGVSEVWIQGGTGHSSGTLVDPSAYANKMGNMLGNIVYPVTYHAFTFTSPDEVYIVINYSTEMHQWMCWGMSNIPDLPGNGTWFAASHCHFDHVYVNMAAMYSTGGGSSAGGAAGGGCPALFWRNAGDLGFGIESLIHHGLDGRTWSTAADRAIASSPQNPLTSILPNAWNDETVLVPIHVYIARTSGNKVSLVADLQNARYARIDFHDPADVIDLAPDEWMIFPWCKKNTVEPQGAAGWDHTGTLGWAIRYEP